MFPQYVCVTCGHSISSLYKRYSTTVLKLTKCETCNNVADKYVEYDILIIIIDLILLRAMAYRHILLNTVFKNFWKLSLILLLLETYSNWTTLYKQPEVNSTEPHLFETDIYLDDFRFYKLFLQAVQSTFIFVITTYILTLIYARIVKKHCIQFVLIWKTITLASCGVLLTLPSLIWDTSMHEVHMNFIAFYTLLSQLVAYKAVCNCSKLSSLTVIFSAFLLKYYLMVHTQFL